MPVSGIKTRNQEHCSSNTPRQQTVPGVGKTVEQRYISKYQAYTQQQVTQPVVDQSGQSAYACNHRLEHRQIESYIIKQVIIQVIYVEQRNAYICQQYDHRDGLVVEHQHQSG